MYTYICFISLLRMLYFHNGVVAMSFFLFLFCVGFRDALRCYTSLYRKKAVKRGLFVRSTVHRRDLVSTLLPPPLVSLLLSNPAESN